MVQTQISGNCAAFYTSDSLLSLSLIGVEGMILQSLSLVGELDSNPDQVTKTWA